MAEGIAYQNKDIEFKIFGEVFREKSFEAYGLKLPRIKEVLPTNLPAVWANEKRMDNFFLLEDGTYALVDYESKDSKKNRIKYVNYVARVVERHYREHKTVPIIRLIVIYTGDVVKAKRVFHMGCMTLEIEPVYVANIPAKKVYRAVKNKLRQGKVLTERELMQLIILPLAEKGKERKQERVTKVIKLAKLMESESEQRFILTGLLVTSDKFISRKNSEAIRREINMTKVGRLLIEEGISQGIEQGIEQGIVQGRVQGRAEGREEGIKAFIMDNLEEHVSEQRIIEKLQRHFRLEAENAKAYFDKYAFVEL